MQRQLKTRHYFKYSLLTVILSTSDDIDIKKKKLPNLHPTTPFDME